MTMPQTRACVSPHGNHVETIVSDTLIALKGIHIEGRVAIRAYTRPNCRPRTGHTVQTVGI